MLSCRPLLTLAIAMGVLSSSGPTHAQPSSESARPDVRIENRRFVVGERPFLVRGIHYGPWRPETGPNKNYPYPKPDEIARDFDMIRGTGANTILIYDAPAEVLDVADRYGLKVVYVFALDWYSIGGADQAAITARLVDRVTELRSKRALLAWMLGNEVGGHALQSRGDAPILAGLRELYTAVKETDPAHPISHANWPPARHLDLTFLDFVSFNVYPLWPPEVVAMGFGRFVDTVLRPIAAGKPLLISEFGANTIEAGEEGQARLIRESWDGLIAAGAAGGIVFEFADEWWKNYNNPSRPGDWWTRIPSPDDERRHDEDPEETYGLVQADRTPKPAFEVVRAMFTEHTARDTARTFETVAVSVMVLLAAASWLWARRRHSRRASALRPTPSDVRA